MVAVPNPRSIGLLNMDDKVGNIVTWKTRIDMAADNFNVITNPNVRASRYQVDGPHSVRSAFQMHKATNIRQEIRIDSHA